MKISRHILAITLMFLLTGTLYSQVISGFGIKGGLVSSTYSYVIDFGIKSPFWRYGITAGIFAEGLRNKNYALQVEADFEQKGGNNKHYSDDPDSYVTLNMLSIPLTARMFLLHGNVKPYIGAGPRADIFLSKNDLDVPPRFPSPRSLTFGGTVVAGAQFRLSKKYCVILEASYSPDFTYFMDYEGTALSSVGSYAHVVTRNIAWELKTGIMFDFAKK